MKTWIIKSGDDQWVSRAEEAFDAAVAAVKRRPPESAIGLIMSVRESHVEDMADNCYLIGTEHVLRAAVIEFRRRSFDTSTQNEAKSDK